MGCNSSKGVAVVDAPRAGQEFDVVDSVLPSSTTKGRFHAKEQEPQLIKCFANDELLDKGIVAESTATSLQPCTTEDVEMDCGTVRAPSCVDALLRKDSQPNSTFASFVGEIMFQYFEKEDGSTYIPEFFLFEYDEQADVYKTCGGLSGENTYSLVKASKGQEMLVHVQDGGMSTSGLTVVLQEGTWVWSHGYKSLIMKERFNDDFHHIKNNYDGWTLSTQPAHQVPATASADAGIETFEMSHREGEKMQLYSFEANVTMDFILRDGMLIEEGNSNNFCVQSKDGAQWMWSNGLISTRFMKTSEYRIMNPSERDWDGVVDRFYRSYPTDRPADTTELFKVSKKEGVFYTIGTVSGVHKYYLEGGQLYKSDEGEVRARLLANGDFQWSHGYHAQQTELRPENFRQASAEEWAACLGKGFDTVDAQASVINSFTFHKDGDVYITKNSADNCFNKCKLLFGLLQDPAVPVFGELLECGTMRWSNGLISLSNGKFTHAEETRRTQEQWLLLDGLEFDTFGVSEETGTLQLQDQFRLVYDYGNRSWVTYSSVSGVHRYQLEDGELIHAQFPVKGQLAFADDGEVTVAWSTGFSSRKSRQQSAFVRKSASDWDRLDGKEFLLFQQGQGPDEALDKFVVSKEGQGLYRMRGPVSGDNIYHLHAGLLLQQGGAQTGAEIVDRCEIAFSNGYYAILNL